MDVLAQGNSSSLKQSTTSVENLKALKKLFELFDTNHSGTISVEELTNAIRSIGHNPSKEFVESLLVGVDRDAHGDINFNGFLEIMTSQVPLSVEEEATPDLLHFFSLFDRDLSGYVKVDDLREALTTRSPSKLPLKEVNEMISMCDVTPDGYINYEELVSTVQDSSSAVNLVSLIKKHGI